MADCFLEMCVSIAQIGAEGNADAHEVSLLAQAKDILHIVQAGLVLSGIPRPERSPKGTSGKGLATGCAVDQFQSIPGGGQHDGVVTDNIATADGVNSNLAPGSFAGHPDASMAGILLVLKVISLIQNLDKPAGSAAGRIFFETVMHLDHLGIVFRAQNLSSLLG